MHTFKLTVGSDGRVAIPNTRPGETVMIQLTRPPGPEVPEGLTLATARTEEEKATVVAEIKRLAHELRQEFDLGETTLSLTHGDVLHDEHGLPT